MSQKYQRTLPAGPSIASRTLERTPDQLFRDSKRRPAIEVLFSLPNTYMADTLTDAERKYFAEQDKRAREWAGHNNEDLLNLLGLLVVQQAKQQGDRDPLAKAGRTVESFRRGIKAAREDDAKTGQNNAADRRAYLISTIETLRRRSKSGGRRKPAKRSARKPARKSAKRSARKPAKKATKKSARKSAKGARKGKPAGGAATL